MIAVAAAAMLQSNAVTPAWHQYQGSGAIAFACAETKVAREHMDLMKDTLVVASPDGFPQHGNIRLLVHDPNLFLGQSGVSTFFWSDDKDGLPMISFFSDVNANDQHVLLLKQRGAGFEGVSSPLSGKPDHFYGCTIMRDAAATQFIAKFVGSPKDASQ